ncbi:hypothetical protein RFI_36796 [Reticulomyxa filosa]|uniref:Uncharacterized protein n=1 Tax=Reticulomyxa filosa TaxID=46433 RepID=X6LIV6_RETFI|nr:hypothetical protein RFI_36796 [Reticulomyxa filosa]|eukprot:ETO00645.1 hypothetical protein RFI_36796 [Reticulomyxa filosa]
MEEKYSEETCVNETIEKKDSDTKKKIRRIINCKTNMCCLDACKADSDSQFVSSKLQTCHKSLIDSFKVMDHLLGLILTKTKITLMSVIRQIIDRPLNEVMALHLPNFRYAPSSRYLFVYCKMIDDKAIIYFVKLNEKQLDDAIEFFIDGLVGKDKKKFNIIFKNSIELNKGRLNKVFECLINAFDNEKITICDKYAQWT